MHIKHKTFHPVLSKMSFHPYNGDGQLLNKRGCRLKLNSIFLKLLLFNQIVQDNEIISNPHYSPMSRFWDRKCGNNSPFWGQVMWSHYPTFGTDNVVTRAHFGTGNVGTIAHLADR